MHLRWLRRLCNGLQQVAPGNLQQICHVVTVLRLVVNCLNLLHEKSVLLHLLIKHQGYALYLKFKVSRLRHQNLWPKIATCDNTYLELELVIFLLDLLELRVKTSKHGLLLLSALLGGLAVLDQSIGHKNCG